MAGEVLQNLYRIVSERERCAITSTVKHKGSGGKRIGYRGVLQLNATERKEFVLTGFSYLPDEPETIGVMEKLVRIAVAEERMILVYFQDHPFTRSMIFDPEAYDRHGIEEAKKDRRREAGERWLNLPREYSCWLREYADGEAEPQVKPLDDAVPDGGWFHV